jgi:hypothetical protein
MNCVSQDAVCSDLHGLTIREGSKAIGQIIARTAQGRLDEGDPGDWLRARVSRPPHLAPLPRKML